MKAINGERKTLSNIIFVQSAIKNPPLFDWTVIIMFAIKLTNIISIKNLLLKKPKSKFKI